MRKKISLSTTVTLLLLTAALTISITMLIAMRYFNNQVQSVSQRQAMYTHINDVDKKVRDHYQTLDEELLRQGITAGYVDGLGDAYAAYYTPAQYVAEERRIAGKANNVGVEVCYNADKQVTVCKVHADSAAAKAGVQKGDVLTAIDGEDLGEKSLSALQKQLNTATKVLLSVKRGETTTAFDLSSYEYTVRSVESTTLGDIGYVKINAFYNNTPDQFESVLSGLLEKGVTGVVFDLRNNQGGTRQAAEQIISYLMPLGMYGTTTSSSGTVTMLSSSVSNQLGVSTVTLVNGNTAGEAEFFAGVLQEFSLTTVVGETTAGKAKYQEYFTLEADRSAVKLTVGEYGRLKAGTWQNVGIAPTLELPLPEKQASIYRLIEPADDIQVQAGMAQISNSDAALITSTTTTETTTTTTTAPTTTTTKK